MPPVPAPPFAELTLLPRVSATLSSAFDAATYPADAAIDGDLSTLCASQLEPHAWLSVAVPSGSSVAFVAVYNRNDNVAYRVWLSPFEVYVGSAPGELAVKCGGPVHVSQAAGGGPFVVGCGGAVATYVTLRLAGLALRYLTIAELEVYATPPPPSPSLPGPLGPPLSPSTLQLQPTPTQPPFAPTSLPPLSPQTLPSPSLRPSVLPPAPPPMTQQQCAGGELVRVNACTCSYADDARPVHLYQLPSLPGCHAFCGNGARPTSPDSQPEPSPSPLPTEEDSEPPAFPWLPDTDPPAIADSPPAQPPQAPPSAPTALLPSPPSCTPPPVAMPREAPLPSPPLELAPSSPPPSDSAAGLTSDATVILTVIGIMLGTMCACLYFRRRHRKTVTHEGSEPAPVYGRATLDHKISCVSEDVGEWPGGSNAKCSESPKLTKAPHSSSPTVTASPDSSIASAATSPAGDLEMLTSTRAQHVDVCSDDSLPLELPMMRSPVTPCPPAGPATLPVLASPKNNVVRRAPPLPPIVASPKVPQRSPTASPVALLQSMSMAARPRSLSSQHVAVNWRPAPELPEPPVQHEANAQEQHE